MKGIGRASKDQQTNTRRRARKGLNGGYKVTMIGIFYDPRSGTMSYDASCQNEQVVRGKEPKS
jgi:hypothetical protein